MKKSRINFRQIFIALLVFFCVGSAHAQQGQSAVFHYCKDGDFQAFMNSEIDSIVYSNIGIDSIEYDNIVTQEVWTPDSCYRIPIENIDSIAFHAPQPRYSEDTFPIMDELLPYIVAVDELSITFSSATPDDMLPAVGQVIVADTWEAPLEDGFAGRVIERRQSNDGIEFMCEDVTLGDIFESLVLVTRCTTSEDADAAPKNLLPRKSLWDRDIDIPEDEVKIPLIGFKIGEDEDSPLSFNYDPSLTVKYEFYVVKGEPARAHLTFTFKHDFALKGSHSIDFLKDKGSHEWLGKQIPIPIPIPAVSKVVRPYVQFGSFLDAKAKAEFNFTLPVFLEHTFGLDYNESREDDAVQLVNNFDGGIDNEKANIALKLEGSLATGLAIVVGAKLLHKRLLNIEGHFHIGPMIKGKLELDANNIAEEATPYHLFKDTKLEIDTYLSVHATYCILGHVELAKRGTWKGAKWKEKETLVDGNFEWTWPMFEWYLLPDFDKPFVRKSTAESAWCTLYPKREMIWPVDLGVTFTEYGTDNVIEKNYGSYHSEKTLQEENMSGLGYLDFIEGLKENTIYKVTPTVTLWGVKMNAVPTTDYGNSDDIFASPNQVEMYKGQTVEVTIIGGSGDYEVDDGGGNIARVVSLIPAKGQKKAMIKIFGTDLGEVVFTVTDRQNPTAFVHVHVSVVEEAIVPTDGLVAYYPFNGNANDESGNGNHGTPTSAVVLATGVNGDANGAYQFGGYDNPGHIYVPNSESLQFTDGATFSVFIKPTSWVSMDGWGYRASSNGAQCIMAKEHDRRGVTFLLSGNDEKVNFWMGSMNNQTWAEIGSDDQLIGQYLNKWIHVAFVYGEGYARLYVDGNLIKERESTPNFSSMNARNIYIGKFSDSWYPFNGLIDEVRIYNRALTSDEIKALYEEPMK